MSTVKTSLNVDAFLDMLAWSEGTDHPNQKTNDRGYDVLVGGKLFTDYSKHPNILVPLPNLGIKSTAAGRYQFLYRTWMAIVKNYGFKGRFIPEAQDLACIKLLTECRALPHIEKGQIHQAIALAAPIWASLPGAGYGQHEHKLVKLLEIYAEERCVPQNDESQLLAYYDTCRSSMA